MSLGFSGFGATCETWNVARQSHLGDRAFLCLTLLLHTMCLWQPGLGWNGLLTGPGLVWVEVPAVLLCVITALPEAAQLEWLWSLAVAHSCLCPWLCRVSVSPLRAQVCVGTSRGTCTPQQALEAVLEQDQVGWLPYSQPQQSLHLSSQHSWGRGGISLSWELGTSWISSMTWVWGQSSQLRGSYTPWVQLLLCNVLHLIPEIKIHEVSWFWKQGCVTKSRWLKGNFILNELKGT